MIYLFNDVKELTGTVRNNHILNLLYEREKNGIYSMSAEIPVTYNDQGTIYNYNKKIQKSDFLGHYDKEGRFQLHKIAAVDIENGSIFVKGIHIFFDEAKAGAIIQDRRFVNREIIDGARVAFESIGWSVTDFDVSVGKTYNFYNVTPLEARQILVETFGFEFDYWLDFDGKKVTNRHVAVKDKIGEKTSKRYTYGHNVLNIRAEQDYSEIYTAVIGRGKGEEIEETGGYGRRIEYTDVVWTAPSKPLNKPAGTRILEDPNATQLFGYKENGVVKPRIKVEVFSDIESPTELIQASYDWLMDNNVPKAVFSLKVADGDGLNLGDEVYVIYRDIDLVKSARVEKVTDDLVSGNRDVEFGDTAYFDTDRRLSGLRSDLKRYSGETGDRIYQLKMEYNRRFDEEVSSWVAEFEQNLIDQKALIEADRENMTNLINTKTEEFDASLAAGMADAERKRQENYDAMSERVTTTVDTTRTELENVISTEVTQAKSYAEQQAQEKAETVRTDLEMVTSGHQAMLDSLQGNVMSIDDFLGDKTKPIYEQIHDVRLDFEERISNINTWHYNILRATRLDEPEKVSVYNGSIVNWSEILQFRGGTQTGVTQSYLNFLEPITLESNKEYTLSFDFKSEFVPEADNIWLTSNDGSSNFNITHTDNRIETNIFNLKTDGYWQRAYIKFKSPRSLRGTIRVGTHFSLSDTQFGTFDIRLVYLTDTGRTQWLFHQLDNTQSIDEITRRVTQLEDGRSEFITKTSFDYETGVLSGSIRDILETVDESSNLIVNHENWILNEGSHTLQMADLVSSKVWMSDIHNPNLIPFSAVNLSEHRQQWLGWQTNVIGTSYQEWVRVRNTSASSSLGYRSPPMRLVSGEKYTASWLAWSDSPNFNMDFDYLFLMYTNSSNIGVPKPKRINTGNTIVGNPIYRYEVTFTPDRTDDSARFLLGGRTGQTGLDTSFVMRHPKIELGERATPYNNAFSNLTQRADEVTIAVQGIGEQGFLNQSDITVRPDYLQIGSQRLDGSNIGSLLRVSPTGIDMVAEAMRLSGDLYVDGDITALAVDAIEGNFARLFANNLTANVIKGSHIDSNTITSRNIVVGDVLVERIISRQIFTDDVTSKVGNFIDLNAGNIVTAGLSANVITSDHIQVGTALIDKMFATSARIDQLITKTHFVNEMHALTLNVVDLNASHIRTRLLSANTIEASWIKSGTALLDRVFASTAMFERMMAKSGFVTTLSAITLDLHELTIWRPDGVAVIQNGMQRFGLPVTFVQQVSGGGAGDVSVQTNYWETNARGAQQVGGIYTEHAGRWLNVGVGVGLRADAEHASTRMAVVIRPNNIPSGASWPSAHIEEFTVYRGSTHYYNINVPLGRPTFGAASWTLEFYRIGDNNRNPVQLRRRRIWISA